MSERSHLLAEFAVEAREICEALSRDLQVCEAAARAGAVDAELVARLLRAAHSLKGLAAMFEQEPMARLAHALESVFERLRRQSVAANGALWELLYQAVERLTWMLGQVMAQVELSPAMAQDLVRHMEALLEESAESVAASSAPESGVAADAVAEIFPHLPTALPELGAAAQQGLHQAWRAGANLYRVAVTLEAADFEERLKVLEATLQRSDMAVYAHQPSATQPPANQVAFDLWVASRVDAATLQTQLQGLVVAAAVQEFLPGPSAERVPAAGASPAASSAASLAGAAAAAAGTKTAAPFAAGGGAAPPAGPRALVSTVRLGTQKLSEMVDVVGELGRACTAMHQKSARWARQCGAAREAAQLMRDRRHFEQRLERLQGLILEARLVPLEGLFARLLRLARQMSGELGRPVQVELAGEQTKLDKALVEELANPMVHLVRNAIDHGIEAPHERAQAGKPAIGKIWLSAAAEGSRVIVRVRDDGRGMDRAALVAAAGAKGLLAAVSASALSPQEALELAFLPGLSTRAAPSAWSGRGVGLDVVKNHVAALAGAVEIFSVPGRGTDVTLTLPLTLAVVPALIAQVAGQIFAIPFNHVREAVALNERVRQYRDAGGRWLEVRGERLALVELREVLRLVGPPRQRPAVAVLLAVGEQRAAFVVDALLAQQNIVIKALGPRLKQVPGIAGAAGWEQHEAILVLDMLALLAEVHPFAAAESRVP